ncbi:MAG: hypothetical protein AB7V45_04075 [Candidatus Krumholzibacteriia bacterium]
MDKENFVRSLAGAGQEFSLEGTFDTMAEALAFAALLGFENGRRVSFAEPSKKIDGIRPEYFPFNAIDLIGLLATRDIASLQEDSDTDIALQFEEFANGGLEILAEMLATQKIGSMRVNALIDNLRAAGDDPEKSIDSTDCIF